MKKIMKAVFIAKAVVVCTALAVQAADHAVQLKRGGLLYDKWFAVAGAKPEGTHPLYPAEGKKSGETTWRCKECHGWDYLGRDGRYKSGSHYTGIEGVYEYRTMSVAELIGVLSGKEVAAHDFSAYLAREDLESLAVFIREGLVDFREVLDREGKVKGDLRRGKGLYEQHCASCHGADGNKLDFKSKKPGVQGVGWLARKNPQESLHKIRWGHPGSKMPSMIVDARLGDQECVDILAYSVTLGE